ncbi:MAG: hypothetical protein FJ087_23580, partial [Deltaproteobacteria bacterium]|nr:hypothetical protein [Deltaproteobacteria bacterium]
MTDFSLRTTPTWLDGIYLALVGVPDLWVVLDAGRCVAELMVESGLESHAWRQRLMRMDGEDRLFVTDAGPSRLDTGGSARMLDRLADLASRRRPGAVLVSEMTPSRIAGEDLDALAAAVSKATGAPARPIEHLSLTRDWLDAIGAALVALARALPDAACTGDRDTVGVIGHLFDRDEADCRADVRELTRLVESLGVEVSSVWTAGEPVARLASAGASRHLLALPYGGTAARAVAARSGARVLDVPLPVGLEGTTAWLRSVGAWLGRDAEAGRAAEEGLREVVPPIGPLVPRAIAGRRIGVVSDPALA